MKHSYENQEIALSRATSDDIEQVYQWQCNPKTRQYALKTEVPCWSEHLEWMSKKIVNDQDFFYIIKNNINNQAKGVLRLDKLKVDNYLISIFIEPNSYGQGIATKALKLIDSISPDFIIHATVLVNNLASQQLFEKAKYLRVSNEKFTRYPISELVMKPYITINERKIGPDYPPYIIAELSANHNGDINRAYKIMEEAKKSGADAIKLQTYTHDTITMDCDNEDFQIHGGLWDGQTLYQLYKGAHMPWDWHKPLFEKAKELNITIFSSPFDFTAVDLLEELDVPAYKIASFELVDLPLIKRVAQTGKPMIMSTGMANKVEIGDAIKTARDNGCNELIVLHCVSGYPAPADQYNLKTIADISQSFNVLSGLSDHTIDNATAVTSVALGACLIEKHVTLDRKGGGADDSFSLEPNELAALCKDTKTAWQALGNVNYKTTEAEKGNVKFRRSLYVVKDVKKGEKLTTDNIKSIRPGYGMHPKLIDSVIDKIAIKDLNAGTPMSFDFF